MNDHRSYRACRGFQLSQIQDVNLIAQLAGPSLPWSVCMHIGDIAPVKDHILAQMHR